MSSIAWVSFTEKKEILKHYNIGRLHFDLKQPQKAKSYFENALKLDPGFDDARDVLSAMELGDM